MIKLERNFSPLCLRPFDATRLTDEFATTQKNVWNIEELKLALLTTSNSKCAYCECNLTSESKYMEVEHFFDKNRYPEHVVAWDNLLPSCKRCNGFKGCHDVMLEPIVNPYKTNPIFHFKLKHYRFQPKTEIAKNTIDVINLNQLDRAIQVRFDLGEIIHQAIDNANESLQKFTETRSTRTKNIILNLTKQLLLECQPTASYAAVTSTILHDSELYQALRSGLNHLDLWSSMFEELHNESKKIALDTV
jgi:hypothetical protein